MSRPMSPANINRACELLAQLADYYARGASPEVPDPMAGLRENDPVYKLAVRAFSATPQVTPSGENIPPHEQAAEAESWVRMGWRQPGDEREWYEAAGVQPIDEADHVVADAERTIEAIDAGDEDEPDEDEYEDTPDDVTTGIGDEDEPDVIDFDPGAE